MSLEYAVVFEKAPENWAVYVPDLPGCISTGGTLAEAETNIRDFGDAIPMPSSVAGETEVLSAA